MMKMTRTLLVAVILLALAFPDAYAQSAKDKWSGDAQRCAVENCNPSTPTPPASSDDSPPQTRRERRAANAQYNKIVKDVNRQLHLAAKTDSIVATIKYYQDALPLLHAQQALRDGPVVRDRISQVEALILWEQGVIHDQNGEYWKAVVKLGDASKRRPDLFTEANSNYERAVMQRHLRSIPIQTVYDPSVVVPDEVLADAITHPITGVFSNSPPGVSERVLRGFQAVMKKDFNLARAWFGDALNHDPGNANLLSFIAIIDQPKNGTYTGLYKDSGVPLWGKELPARFTLATLHADRSRMKRQQVMKALDDIIWMQFIESTK